MSCSASAMSPAPGAALAPASVSLLDLSSEALLVRGLSLVSQVPEEALAGASRAPCPGIRDALGRTYEERHRVPWSLSTGSTFTRSFSSLEIHIDSFRWTHPPCPPPRQHISTLGSLQRWPIAK